MKKRSYVEKQLPPDYIYKLGVYLQTCAQIEFWVSSAICKIEDLTDYSSRYLQRHNDLRSRNPSSLINELEKAASKMNDRDGWKPYQVQLAKWLRDSINNRHIATHGVHSLENGKIRTDTAPKGSRTKQIQTASMSEIDDALEGAEATLQNLILFCGESD